MKIILVNYRYYISGGPEIYLFKVKALLEEAGHIVIPYSVRSPLNEDTKYSKYFPHGKSQSGDAYFSNVKKTPKNVARLLSCAFYNREAEQNLKRLIQDEKPDVVYVLQQVNALSPSIFKACHEEGVRVVHRLSDFNMMCPRSDFLCNGRVCEACIHGDFRKALANQCCHGSKVTTAVRVASMRYHQHKNLFGYVDAFVCPTQFTASKLIESGIQPSKVNVIPTFVNSVDYDMLPRLSNGGYALYLGRISPEKGVDLLVKSIAGYPSVRLKITGEISDSYSMSIRKLVHDLGIEDRVEFTGFVHGEEKAKLIAESSCIACSSIWYENMPNAVLEAYSYGKPVVAFDIGCLGELVQQGVTGLLVPNADTEAFGWAIESLCKDTATSTQMGERARNVVEAQFAPNNHLNELVKVFAQQ